MRTVADFRSNIRKAFNEADEGREVLVERYGQMYKIVSLTGKPDKNGSYGRATPDETEDNGYPITMTQEHTSKFKLPEPRVSIRWESVLKDLRKSFKPSKKYEGYMVHQVIDSVIKSYKIVDDLSI